MPTRTRPAERSAADVASAPVRDTPGVVTAADEIEAMSGDPNFMTSLARGLAVIRGFTQ